MRNDIRQPLRRSLRLALRLGLKFEKEALEKEMSQGHDGLVGNLKAQVALLEQKLNPTREPPSVFMGSSRRRKLVMKNKSCN